MKKIVAWLLAFLVLPVMVLAEDSAAVQAARQLVPASAVLTELEVENGLTEVEFTDGLTRYEVTLDRDSTPLVLEQEWRDGEVIAQALADTDESRELVEAYLQETLGAKCLYILRGANSTRYYWEIFAATDTDVLVLTGDTTDGGVLTVKRFFNASVISPSDMFTDLRAQLGDFGVVELDLELEEGRLVYDGEAVLEGKRYAFEVLAADGSLLTWKKD
ncbi:MAG: PepSY domain-containing protein [Aristaeellaceae bacterium]